MEEGREERNGMGHYGEKDQQEEQESIEGRELK